MSRRARLALTALAVTVTGLWAAGVTGIWLLDGRSDTALLAGAVAGSTAFTFTWTALAVRDRDKELLIRAIAELSRLDGGQGPKGALRLVRREGQAPGAPPP